MDRIYANEPDTEEQLVRAVNELNERLDRLEQINGVGLTDAKEIPF